MRSDSITHRIIIAILTLALLSFYGIGCGGDDDDDEPMDELTDEPVDEPTDQPPDGTDQPPVSAVSYSADIQPIFTANCTFAGCHAPNPPSGLELTSYAKFDAGGNSGPAFVEGDSGGSLIIKRLEGTVGDRMPLGRAPLRDDQIQDIKDWIDEGGQNN